MSTKKREFQNKVWNFYENNKRAFPWRETSNLYEIFLSEIMLQQTQTVRVIPKYIDFLKTFPNLDSLSRVSNEDVLRLWSGLGYNRRALYLKRAAEILSQNTSPITPEFLQTLPGIGPNTAGSIYVFSLNKPHVFIETNIRRVFIYEFFQDKNTISDIEILKLVKKTLDTKNPREWYYALMDYGAYLAKSEINPNRKSKHYAKQSKFEGSVRQARGTILNILLKKKNISKENLEKQINSKHFDKALAQLEKEGFIKIGRTILIL